MKKLILLLALIVACVQIQAQSKFWISGQYSNSTMNYLYGGKYATMGVEWGNVTPSDNPNVVLYGQFKKYDSGRSYFEVEKVLKSIPLYEGSYTTGNYKCPTSGLEGQILTSNGVKITFSSFVPLSNAYVNTTKAEWGIKVCDGKIFPVYYIRSVENQGVSQEVQRMVPPAGFDAAGESTNRNEKLAGKVVSLKKESQITVANYAIILTDDGTRREISSTRPMKVGERVNLEGYNKTVYWDGVMNTSYVFFVTKIIGSQSYGSNQTAPANNSGTVSSTSLTSEEAKLYALIMEYRREKGLPSIPVSKSLTYVAQLHAKDLQENFVRGTSCNAHSWSDKGKWTPVCYTADHAQAKGMWNKPSELTSYKGSGYEIAHWNSASASASGALNGWKNSSGHNAVIINESNWANSTWNAIGVGIYKDYALVWFGKEIDKEI